MKFTFLFVILLLHSCKSSSQVVAIAYPELEKETVVENHHGIEVIDDYRNIENLNDSLIRNWFRDQGSLTSSILDTLSEAKYYLGKFKEVDGRTKTWAKKLKQDERGNLYYLKRPIGEKDFMVFRKDFVGKVTKIFDPKSYKPELDKRFEINYLEPSWNGDYIVLSINSRGDFSSELVIIDLSNNNAKNYVIKNVAPDKFNGVQWLPNNKGFIYLYFPVIDKSEEGYKMNSVSMLHMLGETSNQSLIFGKQFGIDVDTSFFPLTSITSSTDKYVIAYVATVDNFYDAYYSDTKSVANGKPNWKKLYQKKDQVLYSEGFIKGDKYYYLSPKFKSENQVLSVEMSSIDFNNPKVEIESLENEVITDFSPGFEGTYFTTTKNGVQASLFYSHNEKIRHVEIPFETGSISMVPKPTNCLGLIIETDGWAVDLMRYSINDVKIQNQLILAEIPKFPEFETIKVKELEVLGHDGIMIPLSIIYNTKTVDNKPKPTVISSYGAYGQSMSPYFSPLRLSWVANGGVIAVAHIRGGGEKGEEWHEGGRKSTKHNSWMDIISVTEYLINEGITATDKTILESRSAGAISSGMAMIERPDLFEVFISNVPFINPSRSSAGSYKKTSYLEFGDITNPKEAGFIIGMDPYLNLKKGRTYPATIIVPSAKDDRLDLWESGKFIARLQEYNISPAPILLDVNLESGHSHSSTESLARLYGFAKWATEK